MLKIICRPTCDRAIENTGKTAKTAEHQKITRILVKSELKNRNINMSLKQYSSIPTFSNLGVR
jgi:hypothetical protein